MRSIGGDGIVDKTTKAESNISHEYVLAKVHKIKIFGPLVRLIIPLNLNNVYSISCITDMSNMFVECKNFNKPLILDTSKVTNI